MLTIRIGLVSRSKSVDFAALARVANVLNLQVARDLAPIWPVSAVVVAVPDASRLDPGLWPVYVVDSADDGGVGFHVTQHHQPYAQVLAGSTWSLRASHEVIEMLVDPSGNRLAAAPGVRVVAGDTVEVPTIVEYLVEACGPVTDSIGAYLIDGTLVADFVTPHYFDPVSSAGVRYSFSGRIGRPRQVMAGGSLTWFDLQTGKLHRLQGDGAPQIVELANTTADLRAGPPSLRAFVDRRGTSSISLSALPVGDKALQRRDARVTFLAASGPVRSKLFDAAFKLPSQAAPTPMNSGRRATDIPAGPVNPAIPPTADRRKNNSYEKVRSVIFSNAAALTLPGILSVRPGLHLGAEGFTNERVVVVKIKPDALGELGEQIPPVYGDIRVEVRAADPLERLRARNGNAYLQVAAARHELRAPVFDDALYLDGSGTTVDDATVAAATMAAQVAKRHVEYTPPPGIVLDAVDDTVTLVLHVSPDAGWAELSKFLGGNAGNLVVGMHDFTSAHVLKAVEQATRNGKLMLTLDRPAPTPSSDHTGEAVRQSLSRNLGKDFQGAWALTNADPKAPVWLYPNAYHVKMAVRDDDTFWLSSGDWNNANQPQVDLVDLMAARRIAAKSDRDWHVIVASKPLADAFRAHLVHDHTVAHAEALKITAGGGPVATPTTLQAVATDTFTTGVPPKQFFEPKTVTVKARVQPLLTPDNYQPLVKALIESATTAFYLQTQYIHPSGKLGDEDFDALIASVAQLITGGVDVRLITSAYQTDDWMEKLVMRGIPSKFVRRQPGVHNSGIVVDHRRVLVGSHNWSADGSLRNRDAGLIIEDATAAGYFEQVFLHDWEHLATPVVG